MIESDDFRVGLIVDRAPATVGVRVRFSVPAGTHIDVRVNATAVVQFLAKD